MLVGKLPPGNFMRQLLVLYILHFQYIEDALSSYYITQGSLSAPQHIFQMQLNV